MIQVDMDMPDNCPQCPAFDELWIYCRICSGIIMEDLGTRPEWCPLKEVKEDE